MSKIERSHVTLFDLYWKMQMISPGIRKKTAKEYYYVIRNQIKCTN